MMLNRLWCSAGGKDGEFMVSVAKKTFPKESWPWQKLLIKLRSRELSDELRYAADARQIPLTPGHSQIFRKLEARAYPDEIIRRALAGCIIATCQHWGVRSSAHIDKDGNIFVLVDTNALGVALLGCRSGLPWRTVAESLISYNINPWAVFPWVPLKTPGHAKLNPSNWPMNTPDFYDTGSQMIYV